MSTIDELRARLERIERKLAMAEAAGVQLRQGAENEMEELKEDLRAASMESREARVTSILNKATREGRLYPSEAGIYREYFLELAEDSFDQGIEQMAALMQKRPDVLMLDQVLSEISFDTPGSEPRTREECENQIERLTPRQATEFSASSGIRDTGGEDADGDLEGGVANGTGNQDR